MIPSRPAGAALIALGHVLNGEASRRPARRPPLPIVALHVRCPNDQYSRRPDVSRRSLLDRGAAFRQAIGICQLGTRTCASAE